MIHKRSVAYSSHRYADPGISWRRWCWCTEVGIKVPTLDVLSALMRPLRGNTGILAHTSTVELCPQVLSSCVPHRGWVHEGRCLMLTPVEGPQVLPSHLMGDEWRTYPSPCQIGGSLGHVEEADDIFTHWLFAPRKVAELRGLQSNSLPLIAPRRGCPTRKLWVSSLVCAATGRAH